MMLIIMINSFNAFDQEIQIRGLLIGILKSVPVGAWKCNFPSQVIMKERRWTNQPSDQETDQPTDGHEGSQGSCISNKNIKIDDDIADGG